jgi:DNA-binding HxlR family transcriptional regulator
MKDTAKSVRNSCPVEWTLEVIGGKWKCVILWHVRGRVRRFSELRRLIPGATQKMLTAQLRQLERDGLIERKVYAQVPPKVEYSISDYGRTLSPLLEQMCKWGLSHTDAESARRKAS